MIDDPESAARRASLRHVSDRGPGITRQRRGSGFSYRDENGRAITDTATLKRIRSIVIPPAWTDVWISPIEHGHIQATGRDARRRKQYRYHPRWHAVRDESKYGRLEDFGRALPRLRAAVNADLRREGLVRERVLAIVVRLLETTYIRVGNEEYARENGSFGLTTLRNRHVVFQGSSVRFTFTGKSGQPHTVRLSDRRLARAVKQVRDLPGQQLFQYVDDEGVIRSIDSADVNEYIREHAGEEFTAKDFRTWAGTLLAAQQLCALAESQDGDFESPGTLSTAVKAVAEQLRNTPTVCRKQYIHPRVLKAFEDAKLRARLLRSRPAPRGPRGLTAEERVLLRFVGTQR